MEEDTQVVVPTSTEAAAPASGRVRKQTIFFETTTNKSSNPVVTIESILTKYNGQGIKLGNYEYLCKELDNHKSDSEEIKALHSLLFNLPGKKADSKKNIRLFCGWNMDDSDTAKDDRKTKLLDKKKLWTVSLLKTCLGMFGLEKSGDREQLAIRLIDYFQKPNILKTKDDLKRKISKKSNKKKNKSTKKAKKEHTEKKAPSSYTLFVQHIRSKVKEENPGVTNVEIFGLIGKRWKELSAEDKQIWVDKAKELKESLGLVVTTNHNAEQDDGEAIDFGDEDDDNNDDDEDEDDDDDDDGAEEDDFKEDEDEDEE